MNVSYADIHGVIEQCIFHLKQDNSVIQNFLDIETLEEYWYSIELEETDISEYKAKRQAVEEEIILFVKMLRGLFISFHKDLDEPDWMKMGHKDRDDFIPEFFQQLKKLDPKLVSTLESISGKNLLHYKNLFVQWKIARKRELDAPIIVKQKTKQARILKKLLEELIELSRASES